MIDFDIIACYQAHPRAWAINGHLLHLSGGEMSTGYVPELCCPFLDPTFGSMHDGGPSVTTRRGQDLRAANPGGKELCAQFDSFDLRFQI